MTPCSKLNVIRFSLLSLAITRLLCGDSVLAKENARPNIIVILCDDLGWGDLQGYGHPTIKTPHLMRMADEGIRFTNCYSAAPVCSPSRVGLLTGRMPNRAGVYDWIPQADPEKPLRRSRDLVEMRKSEFTIPRMLKAAGYATCMSGKWHCNAMFNSSKQSQPGDHGFDGIDQVDEANVAEVQQGVLGSFEIYDLTTDPSEQNPLPVKGSSLPDRLRNQYRDALGTFHVWPSVEP